MGFNAGESLLGFVENLPGVFDRDVERFVRNDVTAAEEVMVFCTNTLHLALHDAERIRIIVDVLDDRSLVLDSDPSTSEQSGHRGTGLWDPLQDSLVAADVLAVVVLLEELVWMLEVDHHVQSDFWVCFVEAIEHVEECLVEALRIERHFLGPDPDRFDPGFSECREPCSDLRVVEHHRITT